MVSEGSRLVSKELLCFFGRCGYRELTCNTSLAFAQGHLYFLPVPEYVEDPEGKN